MNAHPRHDFTPDERAMHFGEPSQVRELPGNVEAEQALLGTLMMKPELYDSLSSRVEAHHFSEQPHQIIFEAIGKLVKAGKAPNPVLLKAYLPDEPIAGMSIGQYMAALVGEATIGEKAAPGFADTVRFLACARETISVADHLDKAASTLADELALSEEIEAARARLEEITIELRGRQEQSGSDAAASYLSGLTERKERGAGLGVPICLPELQTVLSETAFQPGRLYGMLSSSGEGKTSLTLQIIWEALRHGHPVQFLSYDQSRDECTAQMVAQNLQLEMRRQMNKQLSEAEIEQAYRFAQELWSLPFDIVDCTTENADKLATYAKSFVKRRGNGKTPLIVIDHMGTITPYDARVDEGTKAKAIGQRLKALAKETGASVLVLQQRSSLGMKRPNPRPISADLYGGEAAKQPFDAIFYLYRGQKYREEQLKTAASQRDVEAIEARFPLTAWENKAELGVIKARFADPSIRRKVEFEARFTLYRSIRTTTEELPLC